LITWRPKNNGDHLVKCDDTGKPLEVIRGRKSLRELVDTNLDQNTQLSAADRTRLKNFYRI